MNSYGTGNHGFVIRRVRVIVSTTTHVLSGRAWALSVRVNPAPRLCSLQESEIMLFAGVRARALSGSTPDYPDDEHETLCGCLCVRVCVCRFVFVYGHPERAMLMTF